MPLDDNVVASIAEEDALTIEVVGEDEDEEEPSPLTGRGMGKSGTMAALNMRASITLEIGAALTEEALDDFTAEPKEGEDELEMDEETSVLVVDWCFKTEDQNPSDFFLSLEGEFAPLTVVGGALMVL